MSATIALPTAMVRGHATAFGVFQFIVAALVMSLIIGVFGLQPGAAGAALQFDSTLVRPGTVAESNLSEPANGAEEVPAVPLSPKMRAALEQVSRRYHVSMEALRPVFEAAQGAGRRLHLDPLLIVAVIGVESGFNPLSESVMGAQGLMQIIPRFHQEKLPDDGGDLPLLDPITNVHVGAQVLKESIRRNGGLTEGLQQFGGAANDPDRRYASRVLAEKQRLEQAAAQSRSRTSDS